MPDSVAPAVDGYLQLLQERNRSGARPPPARAPARRGSRGRHAHRFLRGLQHKTRGEIEAEKKEQGFSVYLNGANSAARDGPGGPPPRRPEPPRTAGCAAGGPPKPHGALTPRPAGSFSGFAVYEDGGYR
jgi:hypothetical protein